MTFLMVDQCTSEYLYFYARRRGDRDESLEVVRQAISTFGDLSEYVALNQLSFSFKHGCQIASSVHQVELKFLEMNSTRSCVGELRCNRVTKRCVLSKSSSYGSRALKWPRVLIWFQAFRERYNNDMHVPNHNHYSLSQVSSELTSDYHLSTSLRWLISIKLVQGILGHYNNKLIRVER